jgi:CBS domain-containing protein
MEEQYTTWIHSQERKDFNVLHFFDYDFVYGDKELVDAITETILKHK